LVAVVLLEQVEVRQQVEMDCKVPHLLLAHSPLVEVVVAVVKRLQPMDSLAVLAHQYMDEQVRPAEMVEVQVNFGMHITLVPQALQRE
jgi:hypothetical protein